MTMHFQDENIPLPGPPPSDPRIATIRAALKQWQRDLQNEAAYPWVIERREMVQIALDRLNWLEKEIADVP